MQTHNHITISKEILDKQLLLAEEITKRHFSQYPEREAAYGYVGREKFIQDSIYHLTYLAEAIKVGIPDIFKDYLLWAAGMLLARKIPKEDLLQNLAFTNEACNQFLSSEAAQVVTHYLEEGINGMAEASPLPATFLTNENPLLEEATLFLHSLLAGNRKTAHDLILQLHQQEVPIPDIYEYIFQPSQYELGLLWQKNEITVAHEHYCTAATQLIMASLYPYIFDMEKKGGILLACTVSGDLHEMGIRMVSDILEMEGWDTYYLGANMPDADVVSTAKEQQADILAISVTMPFHISRAAALIQKIRDDEQLKDLKIIVGGYPFSLVHDLWQRIGADGSARSTKETVKLVNELFLTN